MDDPRFDELLNTPVSFAGSQRRFGELSRDEVEARAAELREAAGLGHRSRVGAVAAAWSRLATLMHECGAKTVAELDPGELEPLAEPLWIRPPGGSLLP